MFLSSTLLELRKMYMNGSSSWRYWFKSGLKGEGEAVDMFVNFPKCFSWAPFSLPSETHKGRNELFPSSIWQMLHIYIQSLQRQSTHCHDFLFNLDANRSLGSRSVLPIILCIFWFEYLVITWNVQNSIHCR